MLLRREISKVDLLHLVEPSRALEGEEAGRKGLPVPVVVADENGPGWRHSKGFAENGALDLRPIGEHGSSAVQIPVDVDFLPEPRIFLSTRVARRHDLPPIRLLVRMRRVMQANGQRAVRRSVFGVARD